MSHILRVVTISMMLSGVLAACASAVESNNAGNNSLRRGDVDSALLAFQLGQVLAPDSPYAYYNSAPAYARQGNLEAAQAVLEQAIQSGSADLIYQAQFNLGNVYYDLGRYHDAVRMFRELLMINPDDADARYNMELALLLAVDPTPENQQQMTEPEEMQTDPETTPTPDPNAPDGPTPTPPREDSPPDLTATPEGGSGDFRGQDESTLVPQFSGRMSVDDVDRLLDLIEQEQRSFSAFLRQVIESGAPLENDW